MSESKCPVMGKAGNGAGGRGTTNRDWWPAGYGHYGPFFIRMAWQPASDSGNVFEGRDRATGELKWTGTRVYLIFGSNSELRSYADGSGRTEDPGWRVTDRRQFGFGNCRSCCRSGNQLETKM